MRDAVKTAPQGAKTNVPDKPLRPEGASEPQFALSCRQTQTRVTVRVPHILRIFCSRSISGSLLQWRNSGGSETFPEQGQARMVVDSPRRPGNVAAFRARRIAVSIDWTMGRSHAGSRSSLARKLHANSRNIRRSCAARSAEKSGKKGCESAASNALASTPTSAIAVCKRFWQCTWRR